MISLPSAAFGTTGFELTFSSEFPLILILRKILLLHVENADGYLIATSLFLLGLCFLQLHAFSRPPPVQRKHLPCRPTLQILFKPDEIPKETNQSAGANALFTSPAPAKQVPSSNFDLPPFSISQANSEDVSDTSTIESTSEVPLPKPTRSPDLPDSFAPLLSSSQTEVLFDELTCDLLHGMHVEGNVRLRPGRHEIPLDQDSSRPQLILDLGEARKGAEEGCKITVVASIGSDGFSSADDLDVNRQTKERSLPMVKHAGLLLDPPLPLVNVAPTLIHFPTLFEDNIVKYTLRRIQIVRFMIDFLTSMNSFIEKVLWIIESKCQIHLGKVSVTPLYKGSEAAHHNKPQWRLSLSFSGHVLLFGWIPIPFVNVTLPTWIIPQPHALLEYLLTNQPLASARLNRKKIGDEERITLAVLGTVETWDIKMKAVATPPALSADWTLPGGITVAVETMHGMDISGGRVRGEVEHVTGSQGKGIIESTSNETLSSCTMYTEATHQNMPRFRSRSGRNRLNQSTHSKNEHVPLFDANELIPWQLSFSAKGRIDHERIQLSLIDCTAIHNTSSGTGSKCSLSGNIVVCKPNSTSLELSNHDFLRATRSSPMRRTKIDSDDPSVSSILLFPERRRTFSLSNPNLLAYDYEFDIGDDTQIDAVSCTVGASHPMLKGGTIITAILESIYAHGSLSARENSFLDMHEIRRKRDILRHLPAVKFTTGVQNIFIPENSLSYSDDGQTNCKPGMDGGQIMIRVLGGYSNESSNVSTATSTSTNGSDDAHDLQLTPSEDLSVQDGIRVILDFSVGSIDLNNQTNVTEFPELEIFDGQKLMSHLSGSTDGSIMLHLRPQHVRKSSRASSVGKKIMNPLEQWEIDFSGSKVSLKCKEANATLGHRRLIIPSETTFGVSIVDSVVDMAFDGRTQCEFHWDFQGTSPILQCTSVDQDPSMASHEDRDQVTLLISALRQGRIKLNVSSVGGITITQAATSRENREGLYDWKFFNAIVSPDDESLSHLFKVLHDKRTMYKVLQVIKLINEDLEKVMCYILKQVWRAKEIFDKEGVSDPGKAIPGHKMARLLSLFLGGDVSQVAEILPIVKRVVGGDGLDALKTKELIRKNTEKYEDFAPEIDRAVRWAEVMLGSLEGVRPFVEHDICPLSELKEHQDKFEGVPSAKALYTMLLDKRHLPLDVSISNLVSRIAPFLSFRQVEFILQARPTTDWQPVDLRRLRYVYSVKKKVLDISESYGGLSFLPQSFLLSVFVGEATRASLRASTTIKRETSKDYDSLHTEKTQSISRNSSTLQALRKWRVASDTYHAESELANLLEHDSEILSPAGRVASQGNMLQYAKVYQQKVRPHKHQQRGNRSLKSEIYDVGDSLLGPHDVAILLQAGLTSSMKGSTVVQLNQRMLLDLMASQPRSFAVAVLAEIGSSGGQPSSRGLTSALMALVDLDQSSFRDFHRLDMHALLESWLSGFKIPRRDDYLAGGRWARQSYYTAMYGVAKSILDESEVYTAFKGHIQRVRQNNEIDVIPTAKELVTNNVDDIGIDIDNYSSKFSDVGNSELFTAIDRAKNSIIEADVQGQTLLQSFEDFDGPLTRHPDAKGVIDLYREAFDACATLLRFDKLSFHSDWFKQFYRRNYDALMIKSIYDNVIEDVDEVRRWLDCQKNGQESTSEIDSALYKVGSNDGNVRHVDETHAPFFANPQDHGEQELVDSIIDVVFFMEDEREILKNDPLVRLLIPNSPGKYNFTIVTAMGVITEGKQGLELEPAFSRLMEKRNVRTIRSDTGTARSFEFNASKIEDAIEVAVKLKKPFGLLGYSQGCANSLTAESLLLSGTPRQQQYLNKLVCRQLLFSAANGSAHGPAMEAKIHRLFVMCEEFFKYQQGYCSRAFISTVLEALTGVMDSAAFQKVICGGGGTFLHEGNRAFWREAQHLAHIPTSVLRGVQETYNTPESLEMISNLLTKQAGSPLHDSQVHVYDAVGHPVYTLNRNGRIMKKCDMGGAVQRTHHWSPLSDEVQFVSTKRDEENGVFLCAKDRHVFPWVDVNARFGIIEYDSDEIESGHEPLSNEGVPSF